MGKLSYRDVLPFIIFLRYIISHYEGSCPCPGAAVCFINSGITLIGGNSLIKRFKSEIGDRLGFSSSIDIY